MDYTKDEILMKLLLEIAHEVHGYQYSATTHWKDNKNIMDMRRNTLNKMVEKVKQYLMDNTSK